ncbi:Permease of the drug/metabolite transporter (DMT) superfamily [Robiginitalea myxolifaciens]|uniref:Permease of the drug/metabolite transporter (DMT) superfamily n=1 Tax=Robiginitalea myxolifaciens TaxID=400055 RepID=A0A1I6GXX7_9FLAO|nr:EamA family transporter [Robiginitalea myxolifaciens]SFR47113.1 Permease of the drug/metabolite transporter (DMT) superfamily [Robiginitalea myxolifaciens]
MEKKTSLPLIIAAFFAIYVIWGSTYLLNKVAVGELPPFMLAAVRFVSAGLLVFGIAALLGKPLRISRKQFLNATFAGFLFLSLGNGMVVWALKYVDSNFAALIISAQPLLVMFMMWMLQGQRLRPMSLVGVFLGALGIYLLVSQATLVRHPLAWVGILMIVSAMIAWAYGSLFVGKADMPSNFFVNTAYQMLIGGIFLGLMSIGAGEAWVAPSTWSLPTIWSMALLVIFGSIVAFTSFNFLLKNVSPEKVATNTYVNPIVAMFLGWYFLEEPITGQSMVAALILLTGVYFINTGRKKIGLRRFQGKENGVRKEAASERE